MPEGADASGYESAVSWVEVEPPAEAAGAASAAWSLTDRVPLTAPAGPDGPDDGRSEVGAAGGIDVLAGDPAAVLGGQERYDVGDVGRLSDPVEGRE
jgi:hypothetical protein